MTPTPAGPGWSLKNKGPQGREKKVGGKKVESGNFWRGDPPQGLCERKNAGEKPSIGWPGPPGRGGVKKGSDWYTTLQKGNKGKKQRDPAPRVLQCLITKRKRMRQKRGGGDPNGPVISIHRRHGEKVLSGEN